MGLYFLVLWENCLWFQASQLCSTTHSFKTISLTKRFSTAVWRCTLWTRAMCDWKQTATWFPSPQLRELMGSGTGLHIIPSILGNLYWRHHLTFSLPWTCHRKASTCRNWGWWKDHSEIGQLLQKWCYWSCKSTELQHTLLSIWLFSQDSGTRQEGATLTDSWLA